MFQFSQFIQITLFHSNTIAKHCFSKPFDKGECRFTILTSIEISPTVWVLLLVNSWTDMRQQLTVLKLLSNCL